MTEILPEYGSSFPTLLTPARCRLSRARARRCAVRACVRRGRCVAPRARCGASPPTRIHCAGIVRLNAHDSNRRTPAALGASAVARTLLLASVRASAAPGGHEGGNALCECDAQAPPPSSHSLCARGATRPAIPAARAYTPSPRAPARRRRARTGTRARAHQCARRVRSREFDKISRGHIIYICELVKNFLAYIESCFHFDISKRLAF